MNRGLGRVYCSCMKRKREGSRRFRGSVGLFRMRERKMVLAHLNHSFSLWMRRCMWGSLSLIMI